MLTAVLAVAMLGEQMHAYHVIGGSMSLIGVLIAQTVHRPLHAARAGTAQCS
ncbi:hypothetical protein D3C81_2317470 [compost metagenome]